MEAFGNRSPSKMGYFKLLQVTFVAEAFYFCHMPPRTRLQNIVNERCKYWWTMANDAVTFIKLITHQ